MSWVPLAGSAIGSLAVGIISDHIIKKYILNNNETVASDDYFDKSKDFDSKDDNKRDISIKTSIQALAVRALVAGLSNIIALPIVIYSFYLGFPGCFLIFICSGMIGEIYLPQALAIVTDVNVVPNYLVAQSVALFMFISTNIGGSFPLLIPFVESIVGFDDNVIINFSAANIYNNNIKVVQNVEFNIENTNANKLQYSIMYVLIFSYSLSGVLYLVAFFQMIYQLKQKRF